MEKFRSNTDFILSSVKITPNNGKDPFEIKNAINNYNYVDDVKYHIRVYT